MIIKVSKYNAKVNGHQYNISKKNAEMIESNMHYRDANGIKKEFADLHCLSLNSNENYQFVMSLAPGESFDNHKWNQYIKEVVDEFSLQNHIYYAVKHTDTDNQHIHFVVSGTDIEGRPSQKMRGFYKRRTAELALYISKRDHHQQPEKTSTTTTEGVNQSRYTLDKAIRREMKSGSWTGEKLKELKLDLKKPKTNTQREKVLGNKELLNKLKRQSKDFSFKTLITRELALLKKEYHNSSSTDGLEGWLNLCRASGFYARQLKNDYSIVYGMKFNGEMRYFNEKQLNIRFDKAIVSKGRKEKVFLIDRVIKQQILYSSSLKELNNRLQKNQVSMNLRINATGLYGVVFTDLKTGQTKPLSSLGLKIGAIHKLLNPQELGNIDKFARQKASLTISAKIIIFDPTNSKFTNQSAKTNADIHSSINANAAKILDREQYENHNDDFYDRRKKTI